MKRFVLIVLLISVPGVLYSLVQPGSSENVQRCYSYPENLEQTQVACGALLEGASLSAAHRGEAYFYLGLAEDLFGDRALAFDHYGAAIELIPERRSAYFNRANIHQKEKRYEEALREARIFETRWPDLQDDLWFRSQRIVYRSLERLGQDFEAYDVASAYLELRPDDLNALRWRAWFLKDHDLGLEVRDRSLLRVIDVSRIIELAPGDRRDYEQRSELFAALNLSVLAADDANRALDLIKAEATENDGLSDDQMSVIRTSQAAIKELREIVLSRIAENSVATMTWENHVTRSADYFRLGEIDLALTDLLQADALNPGVVPAGAEAHFKAVGAVLQKVGLPASSHLDRKR